MFGCKHDWNVLSEITTKSKYEVSMEAAHMKATRVSLPWQLCDADRKHILTLNCIHCGKLKRYVENI